MRSPEPEKRGRPPRWLGLLACAAALSLSAHAQDQTEMKTVLERLDRLEKQNAELLEEVRALRTQLNAQHTAAAPAAKDAPEPAAQTAVNEQRIADLEQTKVEASQRFPIRLTGTALFNAYFNSRGAAFLSETAPMGYEDRSGGATLNQSIIGLDFFGPRTFFNGRVHGTLRLQLFNYASAYTAGASTSTYTQPSLQLRTGTIQIDWKTRSFMVGQDKPLVAERNPDSLAEVGVPALSGAGNLWIWQPQARFEQRVSIGRNDTVALQAALFSTAETLAYVPAYESSSLEGTRPGWEGRIDWAHRFSDTRSVHFAPVFHWSATHVLGQTVPSRVAGFDFSIVPGWRTSFDGAFFTGQNIANLGALGQGFTITRNNLVRPVRSRGGWGQVTLNATERVSFHLFGGVENDREQNLYNGIGLNAAYAGNMYYRLAPNVILALEAGQIRTNYINAGEHLRNTYDAALAYLF